jgi:chromosome segregation ATPase
MFTDEAKSGEQLRHVEASIELLRQSMYRSEERLGKRRDPIEWPTGLSKQERREEQRRIAEVEQAVGDRKAAIKCLKELARVMEEQQSAMRQRRERQEAIERYEGELRGLRTTAEATAKRIDEYEKEVERLRHEQQSEVDGEDGEGSDGFAMVERRLT